jgi:hypothetical protein
MDAVGVDLAVLQPIDPAFGRWAVLHAPSRFRSVLSMHEPEEAFVDSVRDGPGIVGLRIFVGRTRADPDGRALARLEGGEFEPAIAACERHAIPLFVFAPGHVSRLAAVAEAHPGLALVVDHLGLRQPPMQESGPEPWRDLDELLELARYPCVAVKACGAPALSSRAYPFEDVWPHLHRLIDSFGAERIMWASDIGRFHGRMGWDSPPAFRKAQSDYAGKHTYAESLSLFRDTNEIGQSERELILGGTARRILRLDRVALPG